MPNEVSRTSLLAVANLVKPALATQAYIPSLTHICFDGINATAYNDITAITVASPLEGLHCCVPGDLLIKALNSFTSDKVLIDDVKGSITVAAGRSKLKLPTLPLADFPYVEPPQAIYPIELSADILKGIEMCLVAVGNDPTHPAQMGVTVESGKDGAVLFSTDNFTISRYKTKSKIKLPADVPVILPTFFCQQLLTLSSAFTGEPITLDVHAGSLTAYIGDAATVFTKQLVDLEAMDFSSILNKYKVDETLQIKGIINPIPDDFDASFSRALLVLGNELDKLTKITVSGGRMKLLSTSSSGESTDSFSYADKEASEEPFSVDPVLVGRASRCCANMALLDRVMILTDSDGKFIHLISHCTK